MPAKDAILDYLGETALARPQRVATGLAANERAKLRMTVLQLAAGPGGGRAGLDREAEAAGLDGEALRRLLAQARRTDLGRLAAPGLGVLVSSLRADLEAMCAALQGAVGNTALPLIARWRALEGALTPDATDEMTLKAIRDITDLGEGDTVHRLVMDLHKGLNAAAAAMATEVIYGARTSGLTQADHAPLQAFMRGVQETQGLKFDHPGLDTTAAKVGERLVIQNDIGTTDAHVIVVAVEPDVVTVTYTDVHRARARFLVRLLSGSGMEWTGLEPRQATGLAQGEAFVLVTGRLAAPEPADRDRVLEALGASLVFLVDWNKARKALTRLANKPSAERALLWAARERVGHRAWLQLGGVDLIAEAVRHAAPDRLGFGGRLEEALGREGALAFLQATLQISTDSLRQDGSERLVRDRIAAELLRRLERSEAAILELAIRQAGLAREMAAGILTHLQAVRAGRTTGGENLVRRMKAIETKGDRLAVEGRTTVRAAAATELLGLVDALEQMIDELEEAAFCASLLPAGLEVALIDGVITVCAQAIAASEALVKAADAAVDAFEGRQIDTADALAALTAVVTCEHEADAADREVFRAVVGTTGAVLAVVELSRSLERSTDWAARAGEAIRRNLMADLGR